MLLLQVLTDTNSWRDVRAAGYIFKKVDISKIYIFCFFRRNKRTNKRYIYLYIFLKCHPFWKRVYIYIYIYLPWCYYYKSWLIQTRGETLERRDIFSKRSTFQKYISSVSLGETKEQTKGIYIYIFFWNVTLFENECIYIYIYIYIYISVELTLQNNFFDCRYIDVFYRETVSNDTVKQSIEPRFNTCISFRI